MAKDRVVPSREFMESYGAPKQDIAAPTPVTPAEAGPEVFSGHGNYKYSYDPSTKLIKILEGPRGVGVTVRPGTTAYKSIMAEKETGTSLWQADAVEPSPAPAPAEEPEMTTPDAGESYEFGEEPESPLEEGYVRGGESLVYPEDAQESLPEGYEAEQQVRDIRAQAIDAAKEQHPTWSQRGSPSAIRQREEAAKLHLSRQRRATQHGQEKAAATKEARMRKGVLDADGRGPVAVVGSALAETRARKYAEAKGLEHEPFKFRPFAPY